MGTSPRIAMVAGEASGDLLGAHLIAALRRHVPAATFYGIGGPKMAAAGFLARFPSERLAVRGYVEVLRHYADIARIRRRLREELMAEPPDAFVGIDAPDFNLDLERALKSRGIPAIHYVSPSIWAWRGGRITRIGQSVSRILALFPFEPAIYERAGIPVTYVGHPLADVIAMEPDRQEARARLGLRAAHPLFALLPGSRQSELEFMADTFVATARLLHERFAQSVCVVPLVSRETRAIFEAAVRRADAQEVPIKVLFGHSHDALEACDAALVASGTATLEAALYKRPMVITYKVSPWSYPLMKRLGYQPYVGLPNILAGRFVVPEFLQDEATPENLAQALGNVVTDRAVVARMERLFADIHRQLRQGTAERAAAAILPYLAGHSEWTASLHGQAA